MTSHESHHRSRSLYTSEDALVQSSRTVGSNLITLYKALGGGWEKEL